MRARLRLLRLTVSQFASRYDFTDAIEEARAELGSFGIDLPDNLNDARKILHQTEREFEATIREETKSQQLRKQHQEKLADEYEAKGDKEEARIIRRMQRRSKKKVYLKCKATRGLNRQGGISHLLVPEDPNEDPKTCKNWRSEEVPEAIQALLQERNRKHFGQSKECNLTNHHST
jgi:uncharacterized protein YxeA